MTVGGSQPMRSGPGANQACERRMVMPKTTRKAKLRRSSPPATYATRSPRRRPPLRDPRRRSRLVSLRPRSLDRLRGRLRGSLASSLLGSGSRRLQVDRSVLTPADSHACSARRAQHLGPALRLAATQSHNGDHRHHSHSDQDDPDSAHGFFSQPMARTGLTWQSVSEKQDEIGNAPEHKECVGTEQPVPAPRAGRFRCTTHGFS